MLVWTNGMFEFGECSEKVYIFKLAKFQKRDREFFQRWLFICWSLQVSYDIEADVKCFVTIFVLLFIMLAVP